MEDRLHFSRLGLKSEIEIKGEFENLIMKRKKEMRKRSPKKFF